MFEIKRAFLKVIYKNGCFADKRLFLNRILILVK
ncbi:hypothetical protein NIASO_01685 [Niabella soli DSM 19437]|uniref:Uncharacterized protein n=1 Tax=Niabella soli DSM 19437 TaxID=929713 RepID=W0F269_9BACT|nr:hypothetical protein NIASO_01685 [Niabella soli DSM 19437]